MTPEQIVHFIKALKEGKVLSQWRVVDHELTRGTIRTLKIEERVSLFHGNERYVVSIWKAAQEELSAGEYVSTSTIAPMMSRFYPDLESAEAGVDAELGRVGAWLEEWGLDP